MKLIETRIIVTRDGYVKDEDELGILCEDASRIVENYTDMMKRELIDAGFKVEIK